VYVLENDPGEPWEGEVGLVTPEVLERRWPREGFERMVFLCGPPTMMDVVHRALLDRGVPAGNIQLEKFTLV
jgi:cytochrome-b5 reductase